MPELRQVYVGIDVHQEAHKAAIIPLHHLQANQPRKGKVLTVHNKRADFEALDQAILDALPQLTIEPGERRLQAAVGIDHTGGHYSAPLVYFLTGRGYQLLYLEAKALKRARSEVLDEENKSDDIDARGMAELLYMRDLTGRDMRISTRAPDLGNIAATLRSLIRQRSSLNKLATRCGNQLHQFLTSTFPEVEAKYFDLLADRVLPFYPSPAAMIESELKDIKYLGAKREKILALARDTVGVPNPDSYRAIGTLALHRLTAQQQLKDLEAQIESMVQEHPYTPILTSFPGVRYLIAAAIIAATSDIARWRDAKAYRKGMGIYATIAQSGKHKGEVVLGREGSAQVRTALYQAVFALLSPRLPDSQYRRYWQRRTKGGMPGRKAIIATEGKMITHIYYALRKGEPYKGHPAEPVGARRAVPPVEAQRAVPEE